MDFLQFWAGAVVLVALEDLNVICEIELFQKPDHALGAGLLEPVAALSANVLASVVGSRSWHI